MRREGSCSASHTNFLTPLFFFFFFFFFSPPFSKPHHINLHLSNLFFYFFFFFFFSLPILWASGPTSCPYFIINGV